MSSLKDNESTKFHEQVRKAFGYNKRTQTCPLTFQDFFPRVIPALFNGQCSGCFALNYASFGQTKARFILLCQAASSPEESLQLFSQISKNRSERSSTHTHGHRTISPLLSITIYRHQGSGRSYQENSPLPYMCRVLQAHKRDTSCSQI